MENTNFLSASKFTVGSVLGRTNTILMLRPGLFVSLAVITLLPSMFFKFVADDKMLQLISAVLNYALIMIIQGAFAYGVFQVVTGQSASFGKSLSRGMSRLLPLIGATLLMGVGVTLCALILFIPASILAAVSSSFLPKLGAVLLMIFFPVTVIILMCMWSVVTPACVVERLGPLASLKRSANLTYGYRLKIFGLFFVAIFMTQAISLLTGLILGLAVPGINNIAASVIVTITLAFPQAFICVMYTTAYYDLRSVKEGLAIDSLVNVFD